MPNSCCRSNYSISNPNVWKSISNQHSMIGSVCDRISHDGLFKLLLWLYRDRPGTMFCNSKLLPLFVNHCGFCYFLQSFTCIVGPNGSGKSNVIDAMLFVFGFRANKFRSKKLSVLIHNSERHQNITSCTVKVHFQRIIDTGVSRLRIGYLSVLIFAYII